MSSKVRIVKSTAIPSPPQPHSYLRAPKKTDIDLTSIASKKIKKIPSPQPQQPKINSKKETKTFEPVPPSPVIMTAEQQTFILAENAFAPLIQTPHAQKIQPVESRQKYLAAQELHFTSRYGDVQTKLGDLINALEPVTLKGSMARYFVLGTDLPREADIQCALDEKTFYSKLSAFFKTLSPDLPESLSDEDVVNAFVFPGSTKQLEQGFKVRLNSAANTLRVDIVVAFKPTPYALFDHVQASYQVEDIFSSAPTMKAAASEEVLHLLRRNAIIYMPAQVHEGLLRFLRQLDNKKELRFYVIQPELVPLLFTQADEKIKQQFLQVLLRYSENFCPILKHFAGKDSKITDIVVVRKICKKLIPKLVDRIDNDTLQRFLSSGRKLKGYISCGVFENNLDAKFKEALAHSLWSDDAKKILKDIAAWLMKHPEYHTQLLQSVLLPAEEVLELWVKMYKTQPLEELRLTLAPLTKLYAEEFPVLKGLLLWNEGKLDGAFEAFVQALDTPQKEQAALFLRVLVQNNLTTTWGGQKALTLITLCKNSPELLAEWVHLKDLPPTKNETLLLALAELAKSHSEALPIFSAVMTSALPYLSDEVVRELLKEILFFSKPSKKMIAPLLVELHLHFNEFAEAKKILEKVSFKGSKKMLAFTHLQLALLICKQEDLKQEKYLKKINDLTLAYRKLKFKPLALRCYFAEIQAYLRDQEGARKILNAVIDHPKANTKSIFHAIQLLQQVDSDKLSLDEKTLTQRFTKIKQGIDFLLKSDVPKTETIFSALLEITRSYKQWEVLVDLATHASKKFPQNHWFKAIWAYALARQDDFENAAKIYRKAFALGSVFFTSLWFLESLHRDKRLMDMAVDIFCEKFKRQKKTEVDDLNLILNQMVVILHEQKETRGFAPWFNLALAKTYAERLAFALSNTLLISPEHTELFPMHAWLNDLTLEEISLIFSPFSRFFLAFIKEISDQKHSRDQKKINVLISLFQELLYEQPKNPKIAEDLCVIYETYPEMIIPILSEMADIAKVNIGANFDTCNGPNYLKEKAAAVEMIDSICGVLIRTKFWLEQKPRHTLPGYDIFITDIKKLRRFMLGIMSLTPLQRGKPVMNIQSLVGLSLFPRGKKPSEVLLTRLKRIGEILLDASLPGTSAATGHSAFNLLRYSSEVLECSNSGLAAEVQALVARSSCGWLVAYLDKVGTLLQTAESTQTTEYQNAAFHREKIQSVIAKQCERIVLLRKQIQNNIEKIAKPLGKVEQKRILKKNLHAKIQGLKERR